MESCPLPMEVCEFIIDAIEDDKVWWIKLEALKHCTLTCRAWRTRAQRRLWEMPRILDAASIDTFIAEIRQAPVHLASLVHSLQLHLEHDDMICRMNELLLTRSIPSLRTLEIHYIAGYMQSTSLNLKLLHPRVLRTRPPLLAHITRLQLSACRFGSLRAMFDMIWACPNLSSLQLENIWDFHLVSAPLTEDAVRILLSTRKHLRACDKLRHLDIDLTLSIMIPDDLYPLLNANDGCLFGTHVTCLQMRVYADYSHKLTNFLPGIFPALTTLQVVIHMSFELDHPPPGSSLSILRLLAERTAAPSKCKSVLLFYSCGGHAMFRIGRPANHCLCCEFLLGSPHDFESAAESGEILRRRFPSLERLCLVIDNGHAEECAAHIGSMLSNLQDILTLNGKGDDSESTGTTWCTTHYIL